MSKITKTKNRWLRDKKREQMRRLSWTRKEIQLRIPTGSGSWNGQK